jgi:hypothetical protein
MNSDKSPKTDTTESANLAKARPASKRTGTGSWKVIWLARSTRYHKTTVQAEEGMDCEER